MSATEPDSTDAAIKDAIPDLDKIENKLNEHYQELGQIRQQLSDIQSVKQVRKTSDGGYVTDAKGNPTYEYMAPKDKIAPFTDLSDATRTAALDWCKGKITALKTELDIT